MNGNSDVLSIVRDGKAVGVVVRADEPTETARYAVEELVLHVKKATGLELEVFPESRTTEGTRIFIGDTRAARDVGIDPEGMEREAYTIRSVGSDLFILGREGDGNPLKQDNPDVGTLFGVYEFLERFLGARWLWPGELGTYVPVTSEIAVPAIDETSKPELSFRSLAWSRIGSVLAGKEIDEEDVRLGFSRDGAKRYARALEVMLRRQRMGGMDAKPPSGHAFSGWWQRHGGEHPEWFAMRRDGTRGHPDRDFLHVPMCVSNEELQDFIVDQWDGESVLRLGPVDRPGRCNCEVCRSWDGPQPEEPPWFAMRVYRTEPRAQELFAGVTSDRYARFWRAVHRKASARNPQVLVSGSFIYENEFPAPDGEFDLEGIYAEFVQWQDPHLRWFPMPEEAYEWIKEQWLGWSRTGIRMGYRPNYLHDGYVMPHFETRQSGGFFKFAYENGMEGARFDSLTGQWAAQGLRLYTHLRLMNKPDLDVDTIREEYLSAFGPAAGTMDRYFEYWERYAIDNMMRFIELYWDVGWRYSSYVRRAHVAFPGKCFEPAEELLERALAETRDHPNPEFAGRVSFVKTGLRHARLAMELAAVFDGGEEVLVERLQEGREALRRLVRFRKENEHTFFSDLLHTTGFWERNQYNLGPLMGSLDD